MPSGGSPLLGVCGADADHWCSSRSSCTLGVHGRPSSEPPPPKLALSRLSMAKPFLNCCSILCKVRGELIRPTKQNVWPSLDGHRAKERGTSRHFLGMAHLPPLPPPPADGPPNGRHPPGVIIRLPWPPQRCRPWKLSFRLGQGPWPWEGDGIAAMANYAPFGRHPSLKRRPRRWTKPNTHGRGRPWQMADGETRAAQKAWPNGWRGPNARQNGGQQGLWNGDGQKVARL